jgi:geranylgeranyl diphosphate synthase type I
VDRVRGLLTDLGAVQSVEQRIAALTGSALDALSAADVSEPAASQLADLAVAATRRRS